MDGEKKLVRFKNWKVEGGDTLLSENSSVETEQFKKFVSFFSFYPNCTLELNACFQ